MHVSELGDLVERQLHGGLALEQRDEDGELAALRLDLADGAGKPGERALLDRDGLADLEVDLGGDAACDGLTSLGGSGLGGDDLLDLRSDEHTSELQALMRSSYAVLCLK